MIEANFSALVGKTLVEIVGGQGDDSVTFLASDGSEFVLFHQQSCCESVYVEDICGEIKDLIGEPILQAEESSSNEHPEGFTPEFFNESFTWTFYRLATVKGSVVIRWLGSSNGYYSESVDFTQARAASSVQPPPGNTFYVEE